jgi:hypothetical protein
MKMELEAIVGNEIRKGESGIFEVSPVSSGEGERGERERDPGPKHVCSIGAGEPGRKLLVDKASFWE